MKTIVNKLFVGGYWMVGYCLLSEKNSFRYQKVDAPEGCWIADPFLYEAEDKHYLFVELYKNVKGRAGIGYYEFQNDKPVFMGEIISQPYHMSYPCVFCYKGKHYMIPETSANDTIELYYAKHFPDKWVKLKDLMVGEKYVDSTVYCHEKEYYLLSYTKKRNGWALVCFKLDMEQKMLHEENFILYEDNIGRPAGFLFQQDKLYRPAQNCREKYGNSLFIYEVNSIGKKELREKLSFEITAANVEFPEEYSRIHTINRDSQYEVIDVFREQFDILHGWRIFKRAVLKRGFRRYGTKREKT